MAAKMGKWFHRNVTFLFFGVTKPIRTPCTVGLSLLPLLQAVQVSTPEG
jgi:hypothetical protein